MATTILSLLGILGLILVVDATRLAFWKAKLDEPAFLLELRARKLTATDVRKYNRAMLYSGLGLLSEKGSDGAMVFFVAFVSLALLGKAFFG